MIGFLTSPQRLPFLLAASVLLLCVGVAARIVLG
jgi:hypothetical protein